MTKLDETISETFTISPEETATWTFFKRVVWDGSLAGYDSVNFAIPDAVHIIKRNESTSKPFRTRPKAHTTELGKTRDYIQDVQNVLRRNLSEDFVRVVINKTRP